MVEQSNNEIVPRVVTRFIEDPYQEDEVNLIDAWISLMEYKKIFIATFLALSILGLLYALIFYNEKFTLVSAIEIGSIGSNGSIVHLEPPESMKSKLSSVLVPKITASFLLTNPRLNYFKTSISNTKGSEIVIIQNKVKDGDLAIFSDYQEELASEIIKDHDQKIAFYQADLNSELNAAQDKLKQLMLDETLNLKLIAVENERRSAQAKLEFVQASYKAIESGGVDFIESSLSDEERKSITQNGEVSPRLLNINLQNALLENKLAEEDLLEALANLKLKAETVKNKHGIEVDQQKRIVESIQAKLDTYNRTRILSGPVPSLKPQGLTREMLTILVIFLSGICGFAAMLLALMRQKVKARRSEMEASA